MARFMAKFGRTFALCASKPHIFKCGALNSLRIVRANVRLNFASPILFGPKQTCAKNGHALIRTRPLTAQAPLITGVAVHPFIKGVGLQKHFKNKGFWTANPLN